MGVGAPLSEITVRLTVGLTATRSISTLQPGTSRPVTPTVVRGGGAGKNS